MSGQFLFSLFFFFSFQCKKEQNENFRNLQKFGDFSILIQKTEIPHQVWEIFQLDDLSIWGLLHVCMQLPQTWILGDKAFGLIVDNHDVW